MPLVESALTSVPRSYFWLKRNRFRKSLNVNLPSALVTSLPKSPFALVHCSASKPGAGNCWVVVRAMVFLMPVGLVKNEAPSSVRALRLTSAKRTFSSTWLLACVSCSFSRLTTSPGFST